MPLQPLIHIVLSIPFYHSTISFQFINTCDKYERIVILLPKIILQQNYQQLLQMYIMSLIDKIKKKTYLFSFYIFSKIYI
jgi:hypothetical protein